MGTVSSKVREFYLRGKTDSQSVYQDLVIAVVATATNLESFIRQSGTMLLHDSTIPQQM
jgi:hypothetical protein